jgi:hypothetical protein
MYAVNIDRLQMSTTLRPLGFVLGGSVVVLLLLSLLFRDIVRAGTLLTVIVVLFFSYGHVYELLTSEIKIVVRSTAYGYLPGVQER